MGCCCCNLWIGALALIGYLGYRLYQKLTKNLPRPNFDEKEYWGKGAASNYQEDTSIRPFKVSYDDQVRKQLTFKVYNLQIKYFLGDKQAQDSPN